MATEIDRTGVAHVRSPQRTTHIPTFIERRETAPIIHPLAQPLPKAPAAQRLHPQPSQSQPGPFNSQLPLGAATERLSQAAAEALAERINIHSKEARVEHIYYVRNLLHTLTFLQMLLVWASGLVHEALSGSSDGKSPRQPSTTTAKRSKPDEPDPAPPAAAATTTTGAAGTADSRAATSQCISGTANMYNTLTAATLVLRSIRREFMRTRDPNTLHQARLQPFIAQADAAIVNLLKSINFRPAKTADSFPPDNVLEIMGLSKELCELANIQLLFHTPGVYPELLLKNGIDIRYSKIGSLGRGAYFSDNASKSMSYFRSDWNVKPDKHHPEHLYMIASLVALGRVHEFPPGESQQTLFSELPGTDSAMGIPRDQREIILFNTSRSLMSFIVYYASDKPSSPPRPVPSGLMIPTALKTFFTQLISRAEGMQLGPDVRKLIAELLGRKLAPADFVRTVSSKLNAPPPEGLVSNLEKQLERVHTGASAAPPAAGAAAAAGVSAPTALSSPILAPAVVAAPAPAALTSDFAGVNAPRPTTPMSGTTSNSGVNDSGVNDSGSVCVESGLIHPPQTQPILTQPTLPLNPPKARTLPPAPQVPTYLPISKLPPNQTFLQQPASLSFTHLPNAGLSGQPGSALASPLASPGDSGNQYSGKHSDIPSLLRSPSILPTTASPFSIAASAAALASAAVSTAGTVLPPFAPPPRQQAFAAPAFHMTPRFDASPVFQGVQQSWVPPSGPFMRSLAPAAALSTAAALPTAAPGSAGSISDQGFFSNPSLGSLPTKDSALGTSDSLASNVDLTGVQFPAHVPLSPNIPTPIVTTFTAPPPGSTFAPQASFAAAAATAAATTTGAPPFTASRASAPTSTPTPMLPVPPQPTRVTPALSAPADVPTRKATVVMPRSLKLFFTDIRSRVKQPADKGRVDQGIFDLIGGTITPQQFLTNMGRIIGTTPPPELVAQLEQQVNQARFKCESNASMFNVAVSEVETD